MIELQEILQRLRVGQSIKAIKRELGKHKTVIRRVKRVAEQEGWLAPQVPLPSEHEIQQAYEVGQAEENGSPHPLDGYREQIKQWLAEEDSFVVIHRLLSELGIKYSETTVRRYIHRCLLSEKKPTARRETKPGEVMEVDFGYLGICWDATSRSRRRTWFFSGRLRHSRRAYREVVFDQKQQTFFDCHIHAFEFFGGVSEKVTPDNLKAAIIEASFNEPLVNRAYRKLAEHYAFMISPCLPYTPEHKGGVESDVKYVKRNFWPIFREHQKQRGREIPDAADLVECLERWNTEEYDVHVIQKVGRTPIEIFMQEERSKLKDLPPYRWDPVICKEATVGDDWRIQFDKAFYTVPYLLIGARVLVLADSKTVRIYCDLQEITNHPRASRAWEVKKRPEHSPPHIEEYLNVSTAGLCQWAQRLGPSVAMVVEAIFSDKAVDGIRPVRGLIGLARNFTVTRLEAACARAVQYGTPTYRSVKEILQHHLDELPLEQPAEQSTGQLDFRFAREYGYFDPQRDQEAMPWTN